MLAAPAQRLAGSGIRIFIVGNHPEISKSRPGDSRRRTTPCHENASGIGIAGGHAVTSRRTARKPPTKIAAVVTQQDAIEGIFGMLPIDSDMALWQAVAGAALVTYGLRVGGRLLAEKLPRTGTFKTFLEALPGTILISLVMPGIMAAGF